MFPILMGAPIHPGSRTIPGTQVASIQSVFTTIPAPAADTVEEGGELVLQVGKPCFDKLLLKREPFLQLRVSRFCETLRY